MQPIRNGIYQHYRTGQRYRVLGVAHHTETKARLVVYQALYHCATFGADALFVRPIDMFEEPVWHKGRYITRFTLIPD